MSLEDFILSVFCLVAENLDLAVKEKKLRTRGYPPKLSDCEVIAMELVGEFLGKVFGSILNRTGTPGFPL